MCAGATWLGAIIMFQLLLVRYCLCIVHCFVFGWGGPVTQRVQGFGVFALTFAGKKVLTSSSLVFLDDLTINGHLT